ncbi:HalOD1 output domain-containing protein [Halorubrum rubrum]|uniref:HalOD1 output domain-containing protein n=1 Tax=Halorubrum rubrum TaxID=1126240 RepID=A0ABD5QYN9_9EURY|nr:HalOD1 output domain-containing protein [Halorubrum rubrum]
MTDEPERLERDGSERTGVVHAQYDWSVTTPAEAVIETVAVTVDREPTMLEPLYEVVDTDALNTIFRSIGSKPAGGETAVSFVFVGQQVTVHARGDVFVRPNFPDD